MAPVNIIRRSSASPKVTALVEFQDRTLGWVNREIFPDQMAEARGWLEDCELSRGGDFYENGILPESVVLRRVHTYYDGGLEAFLIATPATQL